MSAIKGLDHGYLYTKDDEKRIFRSAYTKSGVAMGSSAFITIDGMDYSVGAGDRNIQFDKSDSEMNKVTTLTNLALTGSDDYYLVVGLPIGQYKTQKDKFKKMILAYNESEVIFKGQEFKFQINDVLVMPQGIGALLSLPDISGNVIIFDFGGLTIDLAYLEILYGNPILHKYDTWTQGVQKIYSKIINQVNEKYNLTLDIQYAENILVNGLAINGEKVSTDFLLTTLKQYLEPILKEFQLNYPALTTQIYLCGGSAIVFYDLFKLYYPSVKLMPNAQFANAIGYGKIGIQKFGSLLQHNNYRR
ncbi:MAG: ParM/StbA family protein [Anaerocolumna sp.]|jgi:plasmid segregation protein ParM|nr:ParM/StbA family protein [Anaerocolumna sp.]